MTTCHMKVVDWNDKITEDNQQPTLISIEHFNTFKLIVLVLLLTT